MTAGVEQANADSRLFARTATGLIRGIPPRSSLILNTIPGHPTQTMAAVLLFALATNPGGNLYLGLLLVVPMVLSFSYAFGLLTQMIPRDGGDYMLVSRGLHPSLGLISSICMTIANLLSNAYFGLAVVLAGISPLCVAVGLIGHHPGLVTWGFHISTSKGWLIFFGSAMFVLAAAIQLGGWRWLLRIQNAFFGMITAALLIAVGIALFTPKHRFIQDFNGFAEPYTKHPNAYHDTIAAAIKAGVPVHPAFSLGHTLPLVGVLATTAIYSFWSTFVGGELRQASTIKTANNMALGGIVPMILVALAALVFFNAFGADFLRAANANGLPSAISVPGTPFFFLTAISVGSTAFAVFIFILYIVFWPLIMYVSTLQQTRMLFAYSFDGILPKQITRVNRHGCPWVALLITVLLSCGALVWAVYVAQNFFKVLAYSTLITMIPLALVGVAGVLVPLVRPALYRASASQKAIAGVPIVRIAGLGAIISSCCIWFIYIHYANLGIRSDLRTFFLWSGGSVLAGVAFFCTVFALRRWQGRDLGLVYREIPPE